MMMPRGLLLLAVICALTPEGVRAARRLFAVEDPVKVENRRIFLHHIFDFDEVPPKEDDILDLLNQAYHPSVETFGYGYGYYGYYGYYGHHPGWGYGDSSRESDADFEELIFLGAALNQRQEHDPETRYPGGPNHEWMLPGRKYDVYGMHAASTDDDLMAQRVQYIDQGDADHYRQYQHTHRHQQMPDPAPVHLAEEEVDYSDWEELLGAAFPGTGAGPAYGRYRGAAYGYYSFCLGIYYGGYYSGYDGCGGGYGGDYISDLLDDPDKLDLQETLLEIGELLRNSVREKAEEDLERNAEKGALSAVISLEELPRGF